MPLIALIMVLFAALSHATWNYWAKRAAASRHIVLLYSVASAVLYSPIIGLDSHLRAAAFPADPLDDAARHGRSASGVLAAAAGGLPCFGSVADLSHCAWYGPLLSFTAATLLLGEPANSLSVLGVVLIVGGILLVSGLASEPHKAPKAGIAFGLLIGVFIASYTINDGWAVKTLMISPFLIDWTGNILRLFLLGPLALREPAE